MSGDAFIERAATHGLFGPGRKVLEIGPGYGRLLASAIERVEFESWTGIDLSEDNVAHLSQRFEREDVAFLVGDAETVALPDPADALVSSLTFKHLFPSFAPALSNLGRQLLPGAMLAFDLIEGEGCYFEADGVTYIRWYARDEVEAMLGDCGLELVEFDEVRHLPELARMLVVAKKPG